jgi:hypothetical protein
MRETTIYSTPALRAQWPAPLADQWLGSHPDLFDEDDRRLALAQPEYHFREQYGVQPPDLLVYGPGLAGVAFAEVKGPRDVVSDAQRLSWDHLEQRFGTHVELISVVVLEGLANDRMPQTGSAPAGNLGPRS